MQAVLVLLRNGAKRSVNFVELEHGELSFLASVRLWIKRAIEGFFACNNDVKRDLHGVFETAFEVGHDRKSGPTEIAGLAMAEALKTRIGREFHG